jgi:hypothetical protein
VVISYRQATEKPFAQGLFDALAQYEASAGQAIRTFLDEERLQNGQRWDLAIAKPMLHTILFVPIVSAGSVGGMTERFEAAPDRVDYVLLEWMMALELEERGVIKSICPLMVGALDAEGDGGGAADDGAAVPRMSNFLTDGHLARVPDAVSVATCAKLEELLAQVGAPPLSRRRTAREVVDTIVAFHGVSVWDFEWLLGGGLHEECAKRIKPFLAKAGGAKVQQTFDVNFLAIKANFNKVHAGTPGLKESLHIATALSECLLQGEHDMPTLVWVAPKLAKGGLWGKLTSSWLTDKMVVYFICPYTMAVVGCGPNGEGFEIKKAKEWVTKHAKLIGRSMFVVRLALAAGRVVGVPLPGLSLGDIVPGGDGVVASVQQQIDALTDLAGKVTGCELPSAPDCAALCEEAGDAQGAWKASGLGGKVQSALPAKLEGDDYVSFKEWLETTHKHWRKPAAMTKVTHSGRVEWVSDGNVE